MGNSTSTNMLCFNTAMMKGNSTFDRNRGIPESIRDVEQKPNSEFFSSFVAERIRSCTNPGTSWQREAASLQSLVDSLFKDYYERVERFRGSNTLGKLYDISYWEREVFRCLYGRSAMSGVFGEQKEKRYAFRNYIILHTRELTLRKRAIVMDIEKFKPAVIPFDFWDGKDQPNERAWRLTGANREYCMEEIKKHQAEYVLASRNGLTYTPFSKALSAGAGTMTSVWSDLYRNWTSKIQEKRMGRDEYVKSHLYWFISAYTAIDRNAEAAGTGVADLYGFEFNHKALWMSVSTLEFGFLQDTLESPLLGVDPGPSRGTHDIRHYICDSRKSVGQILEALHTLMEGADGNRYRKGKEVAQVVRAAYAAGLLSKCPVPYAAMLQEFPHMGAQSGYYKYFDRAIMKDAEFQPMIDSLKEFAKG